MHAAEAAAAPSRTLRWAWPALGFFVASLVALGAWLAVELIEGDTWSLDTAILVGLRVPGDLHRPVGPDWLLQSAVDISALGGDTLMWLFGIAGIVWLLLVGKRAEGAWIAASLIGSAVIDGLLKQWIARPRPDLVPHLVHVTHPSFPSGHAMVSAAVYLTLGLMLAEGIGRDGWRGRAGRAAVTGFFALLAVLIGVSRIYLGVHWPSDVLAGWCFGTAWALLVFAANRRWRRLPAASGGGT